MKHKKKFYNHLSAIILIAFGNLSFGNTNEVHLSDHWKTESNPSIPESKTEAPDQLIVGCDHFSVQLPPDSENDETLVIPKNHDHFTKNMTEQNTEIRQIPTEHETKEELIPALVRTGRAEHHSNKRMLRRRGGQKKRNKKHQNANRVFELRDQRKTKKNVKRPVRIQPNKKRGVDLTKYNAYMDAVLTRMNSLIRKKRMDPLRVNLYAGPNSANKNGMNSKNKKGTKKNNRGRRPVSRNGPTDEEEDNDDETSEVSDEEDEDDDETEEDDSESYENGRSIDQRNRFKRNDASNATEERELNQDEEASSNNSSGEGGLSMKDEGRGKGKGKKNKGKNKSQKYGNLGKKKHQSKETDDLPDRKKSKPIKKNGPRPTRGILHGLSTLRRDGNVQVVKDGERARIIRSKFLLGPVALEILPKKSRVKSGNGRDDSSSATDETTSTKSVSPAATATAPQLKGIIEIRLSPGRPTRIRKLRVFPPNNIQVAGDKRAGGNAKTRGAGYRKVTPMATARLRQAAVQVVRQVDNKIRSKQRI